MIALAAACALGFGIGAFPFAWMLHRLRTGRDLRREGSGNPGATNLGRSSGWSWASLALLLEAGKGALAVLLAGRFLGADAQVAAAFAAVLGHVYSPWLSGRGGKGVATTAGAFAPLAPVATAISVLVFVVAAASTRFVSVASVLAALALPAAMVASHGTGPTVAAAVAVAALIAWRHRENFARMRAGTEPRLFGGAGGRGGMAG